MLVKQLFCIKMKNSPSVRRVNKANSDRSKTYLCQQRLLGGVITFTYQVAYYANRQSVAQ